MFCKKIGTSTPCAAKKKKGLNRINPNKMGKAD